MEICCIDECQAPLGRNAGSFCYSLEDLCLFPISSDITGFYFDQIVRKELTVVSGTYKLLK
jgi:hypothetical protein